MFRGLVGLDAEAVERAFSAFVHQHPRLSSQQLRFLQVLCIAPVFPIVVGRVAHSAGGRAIGVINSARIGAAFLGPVIATSLLAWTSPSAVYAVIALMGLVCVPLAGRRLAGRVEPRV